MNPLLRVVLILLAALTVAPSAIEAQDRDLVAQACQSPTTAAVRRCLAQKNGQADTVLAAALEQARARANDSEAFDSAQEKWVEYRDAQCRAVASQYEGGSLQPVLFLTCRLELTNVRLEYVRQLFRQPFRAVGRFPRPPPGTVSHLDFVF